jgi:hypothetical protein
MNPNFKLKLFSTLFAIALLTTLHAQEKYDFAEVFIDNQAKIRIIQNGKSDKVIDPETRSTDSFGLSQRLLAQVSKMTGQGWEVITITQGGLFYMKRKAELSATTTTPADTTKPAAK